MFIMMAISCDAGILYLTPFHAEGIQEFFKITGQLMGSGLAQKTSTLGIWSMSLGGTSRTVVLPSFSAFVCHQK
jgi:hypothetical protein